MAIPSDSNGAELHGVVLGADSCGGQQKSQNLWIGPGGPAGHEVKQQEDHEPTGQAIKQVEGGGAKAHGKEK
jgi:hypothetical protein